MPKKSKFEGPLRPGRGALPPQSPTFECPLPGPKMPRVDASQATIKKSVVDKMLAAVEKKAYNRGFRRGRIAGFSAGFDAGTLNERDRFGKRNDLSVTDSANEMIDVPIDNF